MQNDKSRMGLGRGLGALIGPAPVQHIQQNAPSSSLQEMPKALSVSLQKSSDVRELDVGLITINTEQPRTFFSDDALEELAQSIQEHGILQPLVVSECAPGVYELIAGERRLRAAKRVGLHRVPVIVRPPEELRNKLVLALIENIQRQDLNALEEGRAYQRLAQEYGLSHEEIASRVGKSRSAITNALRLLDLDGDMCTALEEGKITKSHARTLLAEPVPTRRRALFLKMMQGNGVTVREAEGRAGARRSASVRGMKDPNVLALETDLREKLGTKVSVDHRGGPGKITITYYSKEDLRRIVSLFSTKDDDGVFAENV